MKKKLIFALPLLLCIVFAFSACDFTGITPNRPGNDQDDDGEFIFSEKSLLYVIFDEFSLKESDKLNAFVSTVDEHKSMDFLTKYGDGSSEANKHEIVFGQSNREITEAAMRRLERIEKNTETDVRFVVYSDGNSLAVVFDEDTERVAFRAAMEYMAELCDTDKLILPQGAVAEERIDIYEYYDELDSAVRDEAWKKLADKVGGTVGQELSTAMQALYSLYTDDVILWLAGLYEPSICVCNGLYGELECSHTKYCGTAGFYYSNSARDTIGFLPDVESTYQALGFLNSSGVTNSTGHSWRRMLDDDMNDAILAFVRNIQREDGYFVHPQWQSPGNSRISRDLNWATSLLNTLGARPYYDTPLGLEGIGAPSSTSALDGRLSDNSAAVACSKVTSASAPLTHLESMDKFKTYLKGLNIKNLSYEAGNTLTAQTSIIKAWDKKQGLSGKDSYYQTLIDFLNENQNPENGTWDYKEPGDVYYQVNGFMKISGIYGTEHPIPNLDAAVETIIKAINHAAPIKQCVDIYNPWFALHNIFNNLEGCGGQNGAEKTAQLRQRLYETANETLIATRNKISVFKRDEDSGSFSYNPSTSSATSQGCPAAVPGTKEGDVNGTLISCAGLLDYIYTALGLSGDTKVPLFGDSERLMFMNAIRAVKHIDKPGTVSDIEYSHFDDYVNGDAPDERFVTVTSASSPEIVSGEIGQGKALLINSIPGSEDSITVNNQTYNPASKTLIFEGDFCIDDNTLSTPVQIYVGSAYMFSFKVQSGNVGIVENSSKTSASSLDRDLGVKVPRSQWFGIRVEYYYGSHDSVRIKFYFDGNLGDGKDLKLISVSDNYYDAAGYKLQNPTGTPSSEYNETKIVIPTNAGALMKLDNLVAFKTMDKYSEADEKDTAVLYNIDAQTDRKVYNFDGAEMPDDFVISDNDFLKVVTSLGNSSLSVSAPEAMRKLTLPVNNVMTSGRCVEVSFDITAEELPDDFTLMTVVLKDASGNTSGVAFAVNDGVLSVYEYADNEMGERIEGADIPLGKKKNVRIANFDNYKTTIIYIDNEFVGATGAMYAGAEKRKATDAVFTFSSGSDYSILLDNIISERNASSYLDAVKPDYDSKVNGFESADASIILGANTSLVKYGESTMAKLDSSSNLTDLKVPVFNRSKITSMVDLSLDFIYGEESADLSQHTVTLTDSEGNIIFGVVLKLEGDTVGLYEMNRNGEGRMLHASFDKSFIGNIGFEFYPERGAAYIYADGARLSMTESFPYPENIGKAPLYICISAVNKGSVLYVDNVKNDALYSVFEDKAVSGLDNAESEGTLTFEKSNSSSLPSRLHYSIIGSNSSIRIETLLNTVLGEHSNAVIMDTEYGSNDKVGFKPHDGEDLSSYNCVVFETDIKMNVTGEEVKYWLYFSRNAETPSDVLYKLGITTANGKLGFDDRNADNWSLQTRYITDKAANEWHRLKIEYFKGSKDTARIRISLDGEVILVSNNYFGRTKEGSCPDAKTGVRRVYFYSMAKTDGTISLDNMILYGTDDVCTDEVGVKVASK